MRIIKNRNQAQQALNQFISPHPGGVRYTLERMSTLMNFLGNPQNSLKIIHVAGTSGKTSTSYYIASLLHEAGYTVGLTVSPHVDSVNERAQINMTPLTEGDYCKELEIFLAFIDTSGLSPSYFEVLIAFAFWLFYKYRVDYAVVEVGIGGLLDSTNVIDRDDKVCVITDIGLDHTAILGDTIDKIALQKAGIIQPGNSVFMLNQAGVVTTIIKEVCQTKTATLTIVPLDNHPSGGGVEKLPLFQQRNLQLALQAASFIISRDNKKLTTDGIQRAASISIPARMEVVAYHDKTLILDGSHNEQKINALVDAVLEQFPHMPITLLVSFGQNKQESAEASLALLRKLSATIIVTDFGVGQEGIGAAIDPQLLARYAKNAGFTTIITEPDPANAFKQLEGDTAPIGLITGSFYLLNPVRGIMFKS